jgi:flavin reductase (DIM6/NTAB) family NADH-FMN oxidoreductase RutF
MEAEHFQRGEVGVPLLHGALVSLECELEVTHQAGDHLIIIGRVLNVVKRSDEEPLVFFGGAYRRLSAAAG